MRLILYFFIILFLFNCNQKQKLTSGHFLETKEDTISYTLGADIGENLKRQINPKIDFDYDILLLGIVDVYENGKIKIDQNTQTKARMDLQQLIQEKVSEANIINLEAADAFLAKNKLENPDVKETPTGLQYRVLYEGNGKTPSSLDKVKVHYLGRLLNGNEFDSSISTGKPAEFPLNRVIKGWTEGMQLMKEGDKFEFFIHPRLGYGDRSSPKIPGNSLLIFEVELIEVLEN